MRRSSSTRVAIPVALALVVLMLFAAVPAVVMAQDSPAGETPTVEPPTLTPTLTQPPPPPPTQTPPPSSPTPTGAVASATATTTPIATVTPVPGGPVTIPEPVTVVLFGTGLAALSAAVATRRGKNGK